MAKEVDRLIALLQEDNSFKTWSLIVTFFGDAVVDRGGNVSAKTVQTVLAGMNVGSGAVRTAFSRLVADNWIVRQKIGRESFYELDDDGYRPFQAAAARIYSPVYTEDVGHDDWTLAVKNSGSTVLDTELRKFGAQVGTNCWLFETVTPEVAEILTSNEFLLVRGKLDNFPNWLNSKLIPIELENGYQQLQKRFVCIKIPESLSPLDALLVRCLLIHQWRRLLLRSPLLPGAMLASEQKCRQFVAEQYHRLLPGSETWLDEHATCANGKMSSATHTHLRFTDQFTQAITR